MKIIDFSLVSIFRSKGRINFDWCFSFEYFFWSWDWILRKRSLNFTIFLILIQGFISNGVIFVTFLWRTFLECQGKITLIFGNNVKVWNFLSFKFVNLIHSSSGLHIVDHTESISNVNFSQASFELLVSSVPPFRNSFTLPFSVVFVWKQRCRFTSHIYCWTFGFVFIISFF